MGKNCDEHRNWDVPWVTNREFSPSQNCQMTSLTFLICKWKLVNIIKTRMIICTRYIVKMVNSILPKKFVIVKFGRIANPSKKVWKDCQSFQKKSYFILTEKNIFWKDWIYEVSILLGMGIFLDLTTIVSFHFHIRNGHFLVYIKLYGRFNSLLEKWLSPSMGLSHSHWATVF